MNLGRVRLTRDRLVRSGLVAVLVAGAAAAAFGAGYRGSAAVLGDGSAYVQKGHTVVHVNAESGQADAKAARDLATGRQRMEIVQVRPGVVYVVNNETNQVWQLPTDSMRPESVATPPPGPAGAAPAAPPARAEVDTPPNPPSAPAGRTQLVSGGDAGYLFDVEHGTIAQLDGRRATAVPLPSKVDDIVVDGTGTAWALSRAEGQLFRIRGTELRERITVAVPNEAVHLTLAGDKPIAYIPDRNGEGIARMYGNGVRHPEIVLPAQPDGALRIARAGADAPVLVSIDQRDDTVVAVDFASGEERHMTLQGREGARSYGRPVVARGFCYVPDYTRRQVVVLELGTLRQLRAVAVPGPGGVFDMFAREGRVWVNDPYARTLLSFDRGQSSVADKGPGDGVADDPEANPAPAPTTSHPTPPRGPASPSRSRTPAPARTTPPPRLVDVPDVVGQDEAGACGRLTAAELACAPPATQQQPVCTTGKALGSNPAAGSRVRPGTPVTVFVCGPTAVPGPLVGIHVDAACRTVELAGLNCTRHDGGPAGSPAQVGLVSQQAPAEGTPVPNGSAVEVWFYTGVRVPPITGIAPDQACAALSGQGLGCVPNPNEQTWEANVVHGQSIPPGTPVPVGTPVGYVYQDNGPSPLHRWKLSGQEVRFLSTCCPPGGNWVQQPDIGGVYSAAANEVPGLVVVYQHRCTTNCVDDRPVGYYYTQSATPPNSRWRLDGAAFSCFGGPLPGTAALKAMYNSTRNAWAFAPEGSGEYQVHLGAGYQPQFTICHLWYGVPGFP